MAQKFFVEGMTVEQILNIAPSELQKMSTRDLSRALRTVSLAANKRIARLEKNIKAGQPIAHDAVNWVLETHGGTLPKFGVGSTDGSRQQMIRQITQIKKFMEMKTSLIRGARSVQQKREFMLFGRTRQQMAKGLKGKRREKFYKKFQEKYDKVWDFYKKFSEMQGRDPHALWEGSTEVLETIGKKVLQGQDEDKIITAAFEKQRERYEAEQEQYNKLFDDFDYWEL